MDDLVTPRCDVVFEVAPRELPPDGHAPWDATVRVESEALATVETGDGSRAEIDPRRWPSPRSPQVLRVIPANDHVSASEVLRVAFRLSERRAHVFLGW